MTHDFVVTAVHMKLKDHSEVKAICNVIINNMISVNDIRVVETNGKVFVAMPSKKMPDGRFKDYANPVNPYARKIIEEYVIKKYKELINDL